MLVLGRSPEQSPTVSRAIVACAHCPGDCAEVVLCGVCPEWALEQAHIRQCPQSSPLCSPLSTVSVSALISELYSQALEMKQELMLTVLSLLASFPS